MNQGCRLRSRGHLSDGRLVPLYRHRPVCIGPPSAIIRVVLSQPNCAPLTCFRIAYASYHRVLVTNYGQVRAKD